MKLKFGSWSLTSIFLAVALVGLQACGGGGDTPPPPPPPNTSLDSAARGYYEGFATIDVTAGDLVISAPDFKAIFDENKFVIGYNNTIDLVYKGTFTEVSDTTFKADIRVYKDGAFLTTARIENGSIDAGVSIKGTITGAVDYASSVGDVELTYNNANSLTPPTYTFGLDNAWGNTESYIVFTSQTNIGLYFTAQSPKVSGCESAAFNTNNVVNEQTGRVRSFTTGPLSTCANVPNGSVFEGYFTNFNGAGADDDSIFIVASNDDYAYAGVFVCDAGSGNCW